MTTIDKERRRARVLDDPRFERYRTPTFRKRLAWGLIALLVVEAGLFALLDVAPIPAAIGLFVLLVVFVLCLGALKSSTRGIEELSERVLDERHVQLRGLVYAKAYRIGVGLLALGVATVFCWGIFDLPQPGAGLSVGSLVMALHIAITLPTLVAAFRDDL